MVLVGEEFVEGGTDVVRLRAGDSRSAAISTERRTSSLAKDAVVPSVRATTSSRTSLPRPSPAP